ncbi:MAG TPA: hypothetical protein VMW64_08130 [Dehalococcoidia bacterium]|nr:hypothetical protein [Dehalococcoidia bacterium]
MVKKAEDGKFILTVSGGHYECEEIVFKDVSISAGDFIGSLDELKKIKIRLEEHMKKDFKYQLYKLTLV